MLCVLCFCSKRIISMHSRPTIQRQFVFRFLVSTTLCNNLFVVLLPHMIMKIMNNIATFLNTPKVFDTVLFVYFRLVAFASRPCSLYGRGRLGFSQSHRLNISALPRSRCRHQRELGNPLGSMLFWYAVCWYAALV